MLLILALLFFPCAVVGAFVTTAADDHDLLAFQSGGALFTHSLGDGLCGRSSAVAKDDVAGSARAPGYSCARSHHLRHRRVPPVTVSFVFLPKNTEVEGLTIAPSLFLWSTVKAPYFLCELTADAMAVYWNKYQVYCSYG